MTSIMTVSMMLSIIFMFMKHPISMMITILLQTLAMAILCGLMSNLFWFSYIIFLVMIGGMLIIFLYMTNVASNEKFNMYKPIMVSLMICSMLLMMMSMLMDKFYSYYLTFLSNNMNNKMMEIIIMKYYNAPFNYMLLLMMTYLLITMIMTVKISNIKEGALRQKN
uniref:NADH dehydrogenase subunit 6 n=1 Tax=Basiprionota bisignata TaxID=2873934 RepID=UPI001F1409D3|nr:NADH dehydrogenase subunit 6 [Basiprionota bisignata]UKS07054.1 NADH dehydrogenase subunit 6 [Basiprionota bisignata]